MTTELKCASYLVTVQQLDPSEICINCGGECPRPTSKTKRHRVSCIALNCDCNPVLTSIDDIVDPVTGETLDIHLSRPE